VNVNRLDYIGTLGCSRGECNSKQQATHYVIDCEIAGSIYKALGEEMYFALA
jgi:hypothetical protein